MIKRVSTYAIGWIKYQNEHTDRVTRKYHYCEGALPVTLCGLWTGWIMEERKRVPNKHKCKLCTRRQGKIK